MEPPVAVLLPAAAVTAVALALVLSFIRLRNHAPDRSTTVVAVGGGGIEAADAMIRAGMRKASYVAIDTDRVDVAGSIAKTKIVVGQARGGIGAGGNASIGEAAAREASDEIAGAMAGSEVVLIVVALGGGTGSGAAPVVAELARQQGALTVAVATEPFGFEGARRRGVAAQASTVLAGKVDALATVASDRVREAMPADITAEDAFRTIDGAVHRNVGEILDLLAVRGRINLDLAHLKAMLRGGAPAAVGFGSASGPERAVDAAAKALASTLLGKRLKAATSVLVNVSGSRNLKLAELDAVVESVLGAVAADADVTFGMGTKPSLRNEVEVTLLVTGYDAPRGGGVQQDAEAAAEPAAWRPVWLRRTVENQALMPSYVGNDAAAAQADPVQPASLEAGPKPESESVSAAATAAAASAEPPRTKRQKRAAARAARRADTEGPVTVEERSAPLRFPQST